MNENNNKDLGEDESSKMQTKLNPKFQTQKVEIDPKKLSTVDKGFLERRERLAEFEEKQKEADEIAAQIFNMIQSAERIAQGYELKLKSGVFDYKAPYEKIIDMYRDARKRFEEINWKEEAAKLIDTIKFYKEKLVQDKKIRTLEGEKAKKREEELMLQQKQERLERLAGEVNPKSQTQRELARQKKKQAIQKELARQKQLLKNTLQKQLEPKEEEIKGTGNDEGEGNFPFPYIFKPPKPPDDLALAGQGKPKELITKQVLEYEPYCKHCGAELPKGQAICHVCNKKSI